MKDAIILPCAEKGGKGTKQNPKNKQKKGELAHTKVIKTENMKTN